MNENDKNIISALISGGLIGTTLGELIAEDKGKGVGIGALAGAAILATYTAYEQAQKIKFPLYIEEQGKLYEMKSKSEKRFIKNIPKSTKVIPEKFKLK